MEFVLVIAFYFLVAVVVSAAVGTILIVAVDWFGRRYAVLDPRSELVRAAEESLARQGEWPAHPNHLHPSIVRRRYDDPRKDERYALIA